MIDFRSSTPIRLCYSYPRLSTSFLGQEDLVIYYIYQGVKWVNLGFRLVFNFECGFLVSIHAELFSQKNHV